jgi:hypothetical protein
MAITYKSGDALQTMHLAKLEAQLTIVIKADKTESNAKKDAHLIKAIYGGMANRDSGCGANINYSEVQFAPPKPQKTGGVATAIKLTIKVPTLAESFLKDAGKKNIENAILEDVKITLKDGGIEAAEIKIDSLVESRASLKEQTLSLADMIRYVNPGLARLGTPFDESGPPPEDSVVLALRLEELDETLEKLQPKSVEA